MSPSLLKNVFLTGANGFVGSHILQQLLARPQTHVRAVVRSQAKADQVRSDFPSASSRLTFAIVPDITASGAFDHAFENADPPFDTVIHTASPFLFKGVSSNLEFLEPAVKGTTEILTATKTLAPDVKRVVITSSFAAIVDAKLPADAGKVYTSEDWNPTTWEEAVEGDIPAGYRGSKKFAEKAGKHRTRPLKNEN
jgi:nucleoside-diphosphate-sugar epimerase